MARKAAAPSKKSSPAKRGASSNGTSQPFGVALGLTAPVDPSPQPFHDRPYLVLGADRYADACRASLIESGSVLAGLGRWGAIDQWVDDVEILTQVGSAAALAPAVLDQPTLPAGPVRVRPFALADIDLVKEASADPGIVDCCAPLASMTGVSRGLF